MNKTWIVISAAFASGCAPTLYLIDRPTMLEEQAAGEWHDLEKDAETAAVRSKPEPIPASEMGRGDERVLQTLPGEPGVSAKPAAQ